MGLFSFKRKNKVSSSADIKQQVQQEMYDKNLYGYKDLRDSLDYQEQLLNRVNAAQRKYKQDGDIESVIKELEFAFVESEPPCKTSQNMDLVKYYLKAGQNDKAWGYLNRLHMTQQAPLKDIRFEQAKILKGEKKWKDSIEMYMRGYLAKSEWNNTFQEDMFLKDIKGLISKLGWSEETTNQLVQIVKKHVERRDYNEKSLIDEYRTLVEG